MSRGQKSNSWYVIKPEKPDQWLLVVISLPAHQQTSLIFFCSLHKFVLDHEKLTKRWGTNLWHVMRISSRLLSRATHIMWQSLGLQGLLIEVNIKPLSIKRQTSTIAWPPSHLTHVLTCDTKQILGLQGMFNGLGTNLWQTILLSQVRRFATNVTCIDMWQGLGLQGLPNEVKVGTDLWQDTCYHMTTVNRSDMHDMSAVTWILQHLSHVTRSRSVRPAQQSKD